MQGNLDEIGVEDARKELRVPLTLGAILGSSFAMMLGTASRQEIIWTTHPYVTQLLVRSSIRMARHVESITSSLDEGFDSEFGPLYRLRLGRSK